MENERMKEEESQWDPFFDCPYYASPEAGDDCDGQCMECEFYNRVVS